jgi:hypothetical protein
MPSVKPAPGIPNQDARLTRLLVLSTAGTRTLRSEPHLAAPWKKDAPHRRPVEPKPSAQSTVISTMRVGGPHHRYAWRDAA